MKMPCRLRWPRSRRRASPTPRSVDRSRSLSSGTPEHDRSPGGEGVKILSVLFPGFTGLDLIGPTTSLGPDSQHGIQTVARTALPVKGQS